MNKTEININVITGEITTNVIPFTSEELLNLQTLQAAEAAAQQAEATHKQNAIAKLTALGLTADEISALGVA